MLAPPACVLCLLPQKHRRLSVGVDRVGLRKVLIEDRVSLMLWNSWDPLHTLKLQAFFAPWERDMTEHILMIFPTLHEVRSEYVLTRVLGRTIAVRRLSRDWQVANSPASWSDSR